ncbi:hypothetical protein J6590_068680 [Homalodisca vitripennis]|nr:hypothetical protein J6590_068680 [Homalodisca vitripennis]
MEFLDSYLLCLDLTQPAKGRGLVLEAVFQFYGPLSLGPPRSVLDPFLFIVAINDLPDKTLITSLKTTLEVMEEEIKCLKDEAKIYKERHEGSSHEWKVQINKKHRPRQVNNKNKCFSQQDPESKNESHGRHIAGLLQGITGPSPRVTTVVKPRAKFLSMTSDTLPPPHTCTIIIAGTNDVAVGEYTTLLQHLEQRITAKLSSSTVIVSTLPHRHDLAADHPVNGHTRRVNGIIEELRAKYKNLEVVDFNHINRRLFTSHGMHLRMPGKRLFAKLIIEALLRINIPVCDPSSAIMASPADKSPSTTGPVAAAELNHGAKSSFDATGLSDDTEPVAAAVPEHDAGPSSAASPPSAPEPRDDAPVPAELHVKPPAARLTDVADPLSSGELLFVFGPPVENAPRVWPGIDSYADALKMKKED